ncbi:1-deoxy-D-xylulose-5-phosphate reductoisomerase [Leptospira borgpetersenii]|uniref:1-deoxy-D-xylulose 5-phosphate reductoisomerase n=1 Tax=Leptospira borgpetersenii str. Brem 328 TaxID=1049780 RepID=A0ABC9SHX3_LEPBO|nr:1-deoxy-D-xylulose-5-phosphate reductoisomerase [Leptospira borgpetersenii]EMN12356.1 1-deoxy-D-xylulose 5-phosphate reductoisomerase [Leptospira borgpetersenii str. Brem 307]EMN17405.1 1-deoxy-D-xylulose 5-phosphate reductoisomerase [Leptospira borgpetersenii str. Brem 328]URD69188.1 1-deoxy-D-xylulose-5-phosphate reductoisomerase [Leptospira borgpetersenii]UVD72364.1 1-deoxy-D-xylulose-5-phosphate reductoisomerase [Leptospira borgpetersenii]UVD75554.1 1-deoxy-D-xylulose-5-phosphate reduct
MTTSVSLLGASGSVGESTLRVLRAYPQEFRLHSFSVHSNLEKAREIQKEFSPEFLCVSNSTADRTVLGNKIGKTQVLYGESALCELVREPEVQIVITAIVGSVGLRPTIAAITSGKRLGIANKETLVTFGPLVNSLIAKHKTKVVPVDSEHNALFQLLESLNRDSVEKIVLTASGGSFRDLSVEQLAYVTKEQALHHPTWNMGPKITVDSNGMINKGLEVIEAHFLFGVPYERIGVVIHPQSIAHGIVELKDGASFVYASYPDMIFPIAHSLFHPEPVPKSLRSYSAKDWGKLEFWEPDLKRYPGLGLAFEAGKAGGTAPCIFNAANEAAVELFLKDEIRFTEIPDYIWYTLDEMPIDFPTSLEEYEEVDRIARKTVLNLKARKVVSAC